MNLTEALNSALPELPAQIYKQKRLPKADPNLIVREQIQDGKPMVMVMIPQTRRYYPFTPEQWMLLQLFDGERTYQEIADIMTAQTNVAYTEEYVLDFVNAVADQPFWYKTPQEQNISLWQKLTAERRRRAGKEGGGNLAEITFSAWDPNKYLTMLHDHLGFIFTRWFVLANLALFAFMAYVWIADWGEISRDSLQYYNFTQKGFSDLVEFWVLIFFVGFLHESSHGLACKHTGGEVHRMGFLLIYLSPAFFCDVTEAWVFGGKWQRIMTMAAGLWSELIVCGFATIVWWGLPPGGFVHEMAYKIILIAGLAAVLINLNPLCKLDGYFILTELIGISDLKEDSTAYTTAWFKRNVFGLPVEVPYLRWRRRLLFVPYAIASSAYGYVLLFFVVTFTYHIFYRYSPTWAFLPGLGLAWLLFRSRIRTLVRFMQSVYLDKKEKIRAALTPTRVATIGTPVLLLLCLPIWRENVEGRLMLEPVRHDVVRVQAPGTVVEVRAEEGDRVAAGAPLVLLRNLKLESELARSQADYRVAADRATQAELKHADYAPEQHEQQKLREQVRTLQEESEKLALSSNIAGTVVTPGVHNRLGSYLRAGTAVAEVADLSAMNARVYVSESDMRKLRIGTPASLHVDGLWPSFRGNLNAITPAAAATLESGVMEKQPYTGLHSPHFYLVDVSIPNRDDVLKIGMTGNAKLYVGRQSVAGLAWEIVRNFVERKVW